MGLAPYGDPGRLAERFAGVLETGGARWFRYAGWPEMGLAREADENPLEARWADLVAAGQGSGRWLGWLGRRWRRLGAGSWCVWVGAWR